MLRNVTFHENERRRHRGPTRSSRIGRRRLHEGGRGLAQGGRGGSPGGQERDADAESGRGERDGPVDGHGGAGHVVDDGVGLHDDPGQHLGEHRDAENAAEPCGQSGVDEVLRRDARPRVAERLEGADEHALLFHHAGHGGKSHKRRHEEEDEGEERRDGVDAIGIGGEAHHAEVLRAVHDEPIRRLDVVDLLLSVGELLLRFVQLLVGLGRGGVVVGHALLVLGPARLQVGFGLFVFRLALFQLLLAFLDARLGLIEPSLSCGDLRVGGGALLRELRLRLLQGRRRSGDVGDLLLQVTNLFLQFADLGFRLFNLTSVFLNRRHKISSFLKFVTSSSDRSRGYTGC